MRRDNKDALEGTLGRDATGTDLYMAHFLGLGGAKKFLTTMQANPDASAAALFPAAARANRNVFYAANGQPRSLVDRSTTASPTSSATAPASPAAPATARHGATSPRRRSTWTARTVITGTNESADRRARLGDQRRSASSTAQRPSASGQPAAPDARHRAARLHDARAAWAAKRWTASSPTAARAALPLAILLLVVVMVVPIPAALLDVFFVANIAISLAVLMVALNAQKPLDFSAFPTVLLFATLFRLGLNVASTRIVLVHGHEGEAAAGHVIEAFGTFLIGGDYVVGIFVFAILMIINLIVVTKGAGRVSEVSARFTLDALPGKQMAIDADLNAGLITPDEAKARRVEVSTEADFYGSMDGSSKFVKGDAVAGAADPRRQHRRRADPRPGQPRHVDRATPRRAISCSRSATRWSRSCPSLMLSIAAAAIVTRVTSRQGSRRPDRQPVRRAAYLDAGRGHPRRCSG